MAALFASIGSGTAFACYGGNCYSGYLNGVLPVGGTFFGRKWSEPTLIKFAYAFEQATKARRAPRFNCRCTARASRMKF